MLRKNVKNMTAAISGLLFSVGLSVSQMVNPEKVVGFLDISGNWDPSLALVMAGALLVYSTAFVLIQRRRPVPLFEAKFHLPNKQSLDSRLLGGAALFGIGWGLSGICPGPALASLHSGQPHIPLFIATMLSGMWLVGQFERYQRYAKAQKAAADGERRRQRLHDLERLSHEKDAGIC